MRRDNYVLVVFIIYLITHFVYLFMPEGLRAIHLQLGEDHIHHYAWGIKVVTFFFLPAIYAKSHWAKFTLSALYGFGLFLIVDETHMWLWLQPSSRNIPRQLPSVIVMGIFSLALLMQKLLSKPKK